MNPAVLVILWIRLSVTFGYPATLTISTIFGDTPEYKDSSRLDTTTPSADDTQIISIVRVQSTSVVKPKIIVNKSDDISVRVKKSNNTALADDVVTPYVALLRKNRLDVDEDRQPYKIASNPSAVNYLPAYKVKFQYDQYTVNETVDDTTKKSDYDYETSESEHSERIHGEPEQVYGEPEKIYGEPERVYGEPEKLYEESEKNYEESEKLENDYFKIPDSDTPYSFATKINDKKASYIVDNGTYRKYRVEQKTSDGFIVGEYGMVSHRDGSLRGVRYTADININPSLIYQTLVKFLSLK